MIYLWEKPHFVLCPSNGSTSQDFAGQQVAGRSAEALSSLSYKVAKKCAFATAFSEKLSPMISDESFCIDG